MADKKPTPADFPALLTVDHWRSIYGRRSPAVGMAICPVCNLALAPRNREAHRKACARRKRLAPVMWAEWKADMHEAARVAREARAAEHLQRVRPDGAQS